MLYYKKVRIYRKSEAFVSKYLTKQRKVLLDFLTENSDRQLTARQISDALRGNGVSLSAIYRNLAELEKEGTLRRDAGDGTRDVCYRYVGSEDCRESIHLLCKRCGQSIHMKESDADALLAGVLKNSGFRIDRSGTVLYGVCDHCGRK